MENKSKNYAFAAALLDKPNPRYLPEFFRSIAQIHGDILICENQPLSQRRNHANSCDIFLRELGTDTAPITGAATLEEEPRMKVVDLMTNDPLTVTTAETVGKADELMAENNIRQIPVVNGRELVGIVTDRDVRAFLSDALLAQPEARDRALKTSVGDIMTTEPLFITPDDDLKDAVEMLIEHKFGAIPVVDEAEGLVGIVSYVDVLRSYLERLQEEGT